VNWLGAPYRLVALKRPGLQQYVNEDGRGSFAAMNQFFGSCEFVAGTRAAIQALAAKVDARLVGVRTLS
jgi:hypothetical protein